MTQYTRQTIINDALQSFSVCRADADRAQSEAERLECLERADFWLELITDLEHEAEMAGDVSPAETAREAAELAAVAAGYWDAAEHAYALALAAEAAEWAAMGELEAAA